MRDVVAIRSEGRAATGSWFRPSDSRPLRPTSYAAATTVAATAADVSVTATQARLRSIAAWPLAEVEHEYTDYFVGRG